MDRIVTDGGGVNFPSDGPYLLYSPPTNIKYQSTSGVESETVLRLFCCCREQQGSIPNTIHQHMQNNPSTYETMNTNTTAECSISANQKLGGELAENV